MKEIRKVLRLPKLDYYETHLAIINCILPKKMTPMEIRVMASFMALEGDIAQYKFGPTGKKIIMEQLGISPAGLSNYINSLLDKGFLIKKTDVITILSILIPENEEQIYMFKFINQG